MPRGMFPGQSFCVLPFLFPYKSKNLSEKLIGSANTQTCADRTPTYAEKIFRAVPRSFRVIPRLCEA